MLRSNNRKDNLPFAISFKKMYIVLEMAKFIESLNNPTIKWIRKICSNPKKEGYAVFEGEHLLEESLKSDFYISMIAITEEKYEKFKDKIGEYEVVILNEKIFESITLLKSPQGILVIGKPEQHILEPPKFDSSYLYLDDVQDPVNVGILIRSAYSFCYDGVLISKGSSDPYNSTAIARSGGAIFHIPTFILREDELLSWAKMNEIYVYVADAKGEFVTNSEEFQTPFVLILGNEGQGVSQRIKDECHKKMAIKIKDGWDSLNVSSAGSILMFLSKKGKM